MTRLLEKILSFKNQPPNKVCTRQLGFIPPKEVDSMLEHFPSKQFPLVLPNGGYGKLLGIEPRRYLI